MKITQATFLRDVKNHQMTILKDDGVFRCIEFRNPADRGTYFFYLTTFPGRLVISGDCGSYVFSRINDMFQFFRGHDINPGYWSEKVDAEDKRDGIEVFNTKKLKEQIVDNFNSYREHNFCDDEDCNELDDEILSVIEDEHTFVALGEKELMCGFVLEPWEYHPYDFSPRFIWNCYAIQWGIQQYDKLKGVEYEQKQS